MQEPCQSRKEGRIMNLRTPDEILKIKEPGALFTGNKIVIQKEFSLLAKKYHPDFMFNDKFTDK